MNPETIEKAEDRSQNPTPPSELRLPQDPVVERALAHAMLATQLGFRRVPDAGVLDVIGEDLDSAYNF